MKKRIIMLLCTAVLTLGLAAAPAMASAGPYSPIKVEAYTYGPLDELRINKVYRLPATDDPSGIPTEDFVRGNRLYFLLDMAVDNTNCETVTYTAVFGSVELAKDEKHVGTGSQTLCADSAKKDNGPDLLSILRCVGDVIVVAAIGFLIIALPFLPSIVSSKPIQ